MKRKEIISIVVFIIVFALAAYKYSIQTYVSERSEFMMDTLVNIKIKSKQKDVDHIFEEAFRMIKDLEDKWSYYKENSKVWNFNNSIVDSIVIDDELSQILSISKDLYYKTDRRYDVTLGSLTDIWDFENEKVPTFAEIAAAQENTGFEHLIIKSGLLTKDKNIKLNLGSVVKGMIIDEVVEYLIDQGVESGFVNAGGDMRIFGRKRPYKIGIQHPRSNSYEAIDVINVTNKSVVTSGDYERFFIKDGKRYHHIIDPITGYPSTNAVSVTVISDKAIVADAYSTALFLLDPKAAIQLAEESDDIEAVIYFIKNNRIEKIETTGMKEYYEKQS